MSSVNTYNLRAVARAVGLLAIAVLTACLLLSQAVTRASAESTVVFSQEESSAESRVFWLGSVASPVGTDGPTKLTEPTFTPQITPSVSPDGKMIAFSGYGSLNEFDLDIIIRSNSGAQYLLNDTDGGQQEAFPSWSPDDNKLAFVRGTSQIVITSFSNPGAELAISYPNCTVEDPLWLQSSSIIYEKSCNGGDSDIYRINPASGPLSEVALTSHNADDGDPALSPDQTKLAFSSNRSGSFDIYLMPTGGGTATRVTTRSADEHSPDWYVSPAGSQASDALVIVSTKSPGDPDESSDLATVKARANSTPALLTETPSVRESAPDWANLTPHESGVDGPVGNSPPGSSSGPANGSQVGAPPSPGQGRASQSICKPRLVNPKPSRGITKLSRKRLSSYLRKGVKLSLAGCSKPRGSILRQLTKRSGRAKSRCSSPMGKRAKCTKTSALGFKKMDRRGTYRYRPYAYNSKKRMALKQLLPNWNELKRGNYRIYLKLRGVDGKKTTVSYRIKAR